MSDETPDEIIVPDPHDHLRLVDSSLRLHDQKLDDAATRKKKRNKP